MSNNALIEAIIKESRPRVLATLNRYFSNLELAEDALQESCYKALENWSGSEIPQNPTAWLIRVGRNAGVDSIRRTSRESALEMDQMNGYSQISQEDEFSLENAAYKDDILRLMFCCCHPGLPSQDQMALALKIVCGLSVTSIARAFLCQEKAMEKRITRAKHKVQEVADEMTVPQGAQKNQRLSAVSGLVYLLFNEGYSHTGGEQHISAPLCSEAIRLCRLLLDLFPAESEVQGLLSLCLLNHARYHARVDEHGGLIPLAEQNRDLWHREIIAQGLVYRDKALRTGSPGPYLLQAAIAAEHCVAKKPEHTQWNKILMYYDQLFVIQPTPIVVLNRAVAVSKVAGVIEALAELNQVAERLDNYLYFHTTLAGLLLENHQLDSAKAAFMRALMLNPTTQEREYMQGKIAFISKQQK